MGRSHGARPLGRGTGGFPLGMGTRMGLHDGCTPHRGTLPSFFEDFLRSGNTSVQRIYSKILYDMVRRGAVATDALQAEALAGKCFDLLTDEKTPVAVKIWQIELLDDLRTRIGWIEENLTEMVRSLSENPECRPAMAAYARRYLRRVTAGRAGGKRNG